MAELKTNLLTEDDLEFIRFHGLPLSPRVDLMLTQQDGKLVLTLKGEQFFRYACRYHSVNWRSGALRTESDFLDLGEQLNDSIMDGATARLSQSLEDNTIPLQQREHVAAVLSGDTAASTVAINRLRAFATAGPNVIPVQFKK